MPIILPPSICQPVFSGALNRKCDTEYQTGGCIAPKAAIQAEDMASAQQLIGLVKSHAEGDVDRFFDLAMQLSAAEEQKGHTRLAEQLRQWANAGRAPSASQTPKLTPITAPRGDLAQFLVASYPSERLNNVIVPTAIADELAQIVVETRLSEKLEEKGLKPRRRILLSGPPGTGKTLSAHSLAGELQFPLFSVMLHGLITKFMGETAQKLKLVFDAIKTTRGVYLFDEIDALAAARGEGNDVGEARRVLNSFLQFLDEDTGPSIVVATTNLAEILDRAVLRRFDLVLSYELPDTAAIRQALERRLIGFSTARLAWGKVTECAIGLSTADVIAAAEDAARRAVLDDRERITTTDLLGSLKRRRSLQGLGSGDNAAKSKSLSPKGSQQTSPFSGTTRSRRKGAK